MVCDGDAPAALFIQEGVGRLRAFRSAVNAAERAGPHIPVAKNVDLLIQGKLIIQLTNVIKSGAIHFMFR